MQAEAHEPDIAPGRHQSVVLTEIADPAMTFSSGQLVTGTGAVCVYVCVCGGPTKATTLLFLA